MSVGPDFSSDVPLRWTHRRDGGTEIYFVANPAGRPLETSAVFRVSGKRPEIWDPLTGKIRALTGFGEEDGRTSVALRFEPFQSFFIVFREPGHQAVAGSAAAPAADFPIPSEVAALPGPWEVSFDPAWGGPEEVVFESLDDWSTRPEEGIRYYSGTAVYKKTFDLPSSISVKNSRLWLDLGDGQAYRRCPAQRPRPRRRLVRPLARGDHERRQAEGQPPRGPRRQPLAEPAHRRRARAPRRRIRPERPARPLARLAAPGRVAPVPGPPDLLDLEAFQRRLAAAPLRTHRPGEDNRVGRAWAQRVPAVNRRRRSKAMKATASRPAAVRATRVKPRA